MTTLTTFDKENFERQLAEVADAQVEVFRAIARLCSVAVRHRAAPMASRYFGQPVCWVRRLARIYRQFGDDISPNVSFHLYEMASRGEDPRAWLERAVSEGWSAHQLAEAIRHQENGNGAKR